MLVAAAAVLIVSASVAMGSSLAIGPRPKPGGSLVTAARTGSFAIRPTSARSSSSQASRCSFNWRALVLTAGFAVLWGAQARAEERFLVERFPEYEEYRRRVRYRLVPFVY